MQDRITFAIWQEEVYFAVEFFTKTLQVSQIGVGEKEMRGLRRRSRDVGMGYESLQWSLGKRKGSAFPLPLDHTGLEAPELEVISYQVCLLKSVSSSNRPRPLIGPILPMLAVWILSFSRSCSHTGFCLRANADFYARGVPDVITGWENGTKTHWLSPGLDVRLSFQSLLRFMLFNHRVSVILFKTNNLKWTNVKRDRWFITETLLCSCVRVTFGTVGAIARTQTRQHTQTQVCFSFEKQKPWWVTMVSLAILYVLTQQRNLPEYDHSSTF